MMKKLRKSNLEMLRIISMILILMSHCDDIFGLNTLYSVSLGANKIITDCLHMGGQIGVGCFILITGYFMVEKKITVKKLLVIAGEVWFYTIVFFFAWIIIKFMVFGAGEIGLGICVKEGFFAFFPIISSHYWFVTAYFILMLLSPFLNKLIFALDCVSYRNFLIILIVVFCFIKGVFPFALTYLQMGRLVPIFILYFVAGYIKRYRGGKKKNASRHIIVSMVLYLILLALTYFLTYLGLRYNSDFIINNIYYYRESYSPFVVAISLELFNGFSELDIKNNQVINEIAGCTFGVYLIHQNRLFYPVLCKIFPIYKVNESILVLLYSVLAVFVIYVGCSMIDFVRRKTVEKLWLLLLDNYLELIQTKVCKVMVSFLGVIKRMVE